MAGGRAARTNGRRWRGAATLPAVRVLVVTNITPDPASPSRGIFVRDQVAALRRAGVEVELLSFPSGRWNYPRAVPQIRRLLRRERFDLVHAHYGLAGWCASLAGARPLIVTFHGTDVRHPTVGRLSRRLVRRLDLVAGASRALFAPEAERPGLPKRPGATAVLPCGADLDRFGRAPRRGSGWASIPRADTCCSQPRPSGPRSATTAPSRSGAWRARSC
jgi:teichuronic acid biosynthesis glycosyltransferase TuaC